MKRSLALFIASLCFMVAINALAQNDSPSTRNSQNQKAEDQRSQTEKPPVPTGVSVSIAATPAEVTSSPKGDQPTNNAQGWNDWFWQNLTGFLLVLVGIWAARIALSTLDQIAEQTKAGTIAANAAKTAAEAAEKNTTVSERTMIIDQRAYLYLSGIRLMLLDDSNIELTYPILNAGKTPAKYTGEFTRANIYPYQHYPDPINRGSVVTIKKGVVVAPALTDESAVKGKYYLVVTPEEIAAIERREVWIIFHGFIRYEDIFGQVSDTGFGVAYTGQLSPKHTLYMDWIQRLGFNWFD